jgi:hypothetical protein
MEISKQQIKFDAVLLSWLCGGLSIGNAVLLKNS